MANVLKMAKIQSIQQLHAAGWSQRRIASELEIDRGTVARYLRPPPADPKPAILPSGSEGPNAATSLPLPALTAAASGGSEGADFPAGPKPAISPAGSEGEILVPAARSASTSRRGRPGQCEAYAELIQAKLDQGLTAQRIWQDLVAEHGFVGRYDSVKRYVRRLGARTPLPFRRMECAPGEEAQVDFGKGAPVIIPGGKCRKTNVFRIVLSHSRKAYSEATFTQTTEDFFRCLENAFAHFGGVPKTLVIDNLKAAVAHPDWFDPELTPKVQSFCRHYGTVILPTKPYTPRHKGKIESGVKYVKNNALKARQFASLEEQNRCLADWERTVADTRVHGTTKRQVKLIFEQAERGALLPLPLERFAHFHEGKRKVNRDGHVEVAKAYYSAPPEYLGREVWVRWDARLVHIFNHRFEQIAIHTRREQGRFSTHAQHIAKEKISGLERGAAYLLNKVGVVGPFTRQWSQAVVSARGIEGTRVLQGLLSLTKKHPCEALEKACEIALSHGCWRLRAVRRLLGRKAAKQEPLPFLEEHPIIRPLADYSDIVVRAFHRQADRPSAGEGFGRHGWTKVCAETAPAPAKENPGARCNLHRGSLPPRSGYASPGCTSAEPGSVSPDHSSVVPTSSFHQESSDE
jgi:transposase